MTPILRAWRATHTTRWHRHPEMCGTGDDIGGHQHRVSILAMLMFPSRPNVVMAAMLHDMGEAAVGDVANPVKEAHPALRNALDAVEEHEMAAMGLPAVTLSAAERTMLRLCDKLDAYLWANMHRPDLMEGNGWPNDRAEILQLARDCDKFLTVNTIIKEARA